MHGFDEFFGYLYHLDAMEDPAHPNYPPELKERTGPRNMIHSWATDQDDPTEQPRWGKVGKQKIEDAGPLYPKRMETVDDEILDLSLKFIEKAKSDDKPFFVWLNSTRMHVVTHLSEKYQKLRTPGERLVDPRSRHGAARRHRRRGHEEARRARPRRRHDRRLHHRQRHGELHLARRRPDAVRRRQGNGHGGWLPRAVHDPLAGQVPAGKVENGIISGLDWFPTFVAAAGNPNIVDELKRARRSATGPYKVHLDGYNQLDLITGKGPSKRQEIFYFAEGTLGAVRIDDYKYRFIDQPNGWLGGTVKPDWPILVNLRLDPVRAHRPEPDRSSFYQLVHVRVLAIRLRPAGSGQVRPDVHRVPADAEGRHFNLEAVKEQLLKASQARGR